MDKTKLTEILDIAFKSSTFLIALVNLFLVIRFFKLKNRREDIDKEKDRKIQWLKTLVLDNNLKNFYTLFDQIENELQGIKKAGITLDEKKEVGQKISDLFISLRRKFTDSLLGVDKKLYEEILAKSDDLQKYFTDTIFDNGINLSHTPKFDELIMNKLTVGKTNMIQVLFSYRG